MKLKVLMLVILIGLLNLEAKVINVGGKNINLTDPNGYVGVKGRSVEFDKASNYMVAPTNKQLEVFLSKDFDFKNKHLIEYDFEKYILVQTPKDLINKKFTLKNFRGTTNYMKKNFSQMFEKLDPKMRKAFAKTSKEMSAEYDTKIDIKLGGMVPIEIFIDKEKALSSLSLMNINNETLVASINLLLLNQKMIFVYIYSTYKSNKDVEYVKNLTKNYVNNLLKNNY